MASVNQAVKDTLLNLRKRSVDATPNAYAREFCRVAKRIDLTVKECDKFVQIVKQLSSHEQQIVKENNIQTFEDIIPVLLRRAHPKNIQTMASLINQSLQPSISINLNEDLHKFSVKIGNSPELLFESDIQQEIKKFIEKRIDLDKNELEQKAKEIAKVMTFMTQYLAEAIDNNSEGSLHISNITKNIQSLDATSHKDLVVMQDKLVDAAKSIENVMSKTNDKLKSGHDQVQALQQKIEQLEEELKKTKKESDTDHLTGLLTRRAYDNQIKRIEDNFQRNNVNYAIVFCDIDHFKKVNDTYGHDAGDVILSTFAKVLLKSTRGLDIVGRYGGEEFVAVVHFKEPQELEAYASRVKSIVTKHKFKYNNLKIPITFSAGVTIRSDNKSYEQTIKKADELLYVAKQTGRNKIVFQDGTEL